MKNVMCSTVGWAFFATGTVWYVVNLYLLFVRDLSFFLPLSLGGGPC